MKRIFVLLLAVILTMGLICPVYAGEATEPVTGEIPGNIAAAFSGEAEEEDVILPEEAVLSSEEAVPGKDEAEEFPEEAVPAEESAAPTEEAVLPETTAETSEEAVLLEEAVEAFPDEDPAYLEGLLEEMADVAINSSNFPDVSFRGGGRRGYPRLF